MIQDKDRRVAGRPKAQSHLEFSGNQQKTSTSTLPANAHVSSETAEPVSQKRPYDDIERVRIWLL
jgi:hypothetical protein